MKKISTTLFAIAILQACNNAPTPIIYGKDICHACKMTIMDKKFGAELINANGKTVKFDSGECMLAYLKADNTFKPAQHLVVNYTNPAELIEADKAFYLHGGNVNSPMGGNLAAFKTREDAQKQQAVLGGDIILWSDANQIQF